MAILMLVVVFLSSCKKCWDNVLKQAPTTYFYSEFLGLHSTDVSSPGLVRLDAV